MKNNVFLAGKAKNVRVNEYNGRDFVSFTAVIEDPTRRREDGTAISSFIPVSVSGPQATRLKEKLKDGSNVCVEGHFEPTKKDDTMRYPVNATSVETMDAGDVNHALIQGRLTRDPELRTTNNGTEVCTVPIATTRSYSDKNGEWHDVTSFITIIGWGNQAKALITFDKGKMVWAIGRLTSRKWTDKNGKDHYPVEVVLEAVHDGGTGRYNQNGNTAAEQPKASEPDPAASSNDTFDDSGMFDGGFEDFLDEELPFN